MVQEATLQVPREDWQDPELQRLLRTQRPTNSRSQSETAEFLQAWHKKVPEEEARRLDAAIRAVRQADVDSQE